jgi:translation initiation factor IF-2
VAPHPRQYETQEETKNLEIVLKCDSVGSTEAVISTLVQERESRGEIEIIHNGVGAVSKSDLLMALSGSRLVAGFNTDVMPNLEQVCREQQVEVRLYNVIYRLSQDLREIAGSLNIREEEEDKVLGKARVIALFKSSRKGVILGCEVIEGTLRPGQTFRVIAAMGPVYTGRIESLHIEKDEVRSADVGQQVGLKITGFSKVSVGDFVESFEVRMTKKETPWQPSGSIIRLTE